MTDYKLVPVEPTDEMVSAAEDAYMPFGDMEMAIRMAVLAAPAVQGEPVGWQFYQDGKWWHGDDRIKDHRKNTEEAGYLTRDVYAAPQPAEQQPDDSAAARLDKQCREDVAAALGFIRGGNYAWSYLLQQIKDITSAEGKQPAPDVAGLVEALEQCITSMLDSGYRANALVIRAARAALAAYRKGGEV